jgi:hypothetical protein
MYPAYQPASHLTTHSRKPRIAASQTGSYPQQPDKHRSQSAKLISQPRTAASQGQQPATHSIQPRSVASHQH